MINNRIDFLKTVCNPDLENETIEIRFLDKDGRMESFFSDNLTIINDKIEEQKQNKNVFFGIAPRKNNNSGKKEDCTSISALWVDVDCGQDGHKKSSRFITKQKSLEHIEQIPIKPSIILDSGHGLHLYYLLDQKISLNESNINLMEDLNKKLTYIFGGDTSCYNIAQILRVPDTLNIKTDPALPTRLRLYNPEIKNSISDLLKNPLIRIDWQKLSKLKIKNISVLDLLFGINIESLEKESNSEADQSIITALLSNGFFEEEIKLLFKHYPVSGKYHTHSSPDQYISKSIENAKKYITENPLAILSGSVNINPEYFEDVDTPDQFGYVDDNGNLLSNFTIKLDEIVQRTRDGVVSSVLNGKILLKDEVKHFKNIESDIFVENKKFKSFIIDYQPTKSEFYGNICEIINAVRYCNKNIIPTSEIEFGYNETLTEYRTENLIINSKGIFEAKHFIRHSDELNFIKLHFDKVNDQQLEIIKKQIVENLFKWDTAEVVFNSLAFAFLPIIYPFLKSIHGAKPYLYLKGITGSGKSLMSILVQRFFGSFEKLVSCTSTSTAINIVGAGFKDTLYVVDDLKFENFRNDNELKNFMALIQNYSDGTERHKGTRDSKLKDSAPIKAILLLNGEDLIIRESSTIARGIIINVNTKQYDIEKKDNLEDISKEFSGLTPHYINYILSNKSKEDIINLFKLNRKYFEEKARYSQQGSWDNLPRIISNFAMVKTSWDLLINFLCNDRDQIIRYNSEYDKAMTDLFDQTLNRVDDSKNNMKFELALWSLIEAEKIYLEKIDTTGNNSWQNYKGTKIGYFFISGKQAKICINLKNALREIKRFEPEISITEETLKNKLIKDNKIKENPSKKVSFGKIKKEGIEWIGDYPRNLFGLPENNDALTTAQEILSESYSDENINHLTTFDFLADLPESDLSELKSKTKDDENVQF